LLTGFSRFLNYWRLNQYFQNHNIFTAELYVFRWGLSTTNATLRLTEIILTPWNNNNRFFADVFHDLTKAFDCVNHELLLTKLLFYGVKGLLLGRFKSYLYYRKQRVEIKFSVTSSCSSTWKTVKCSILQGSVLGVLPFNIYISDLLGSVDNNSYVIMYVDDTSILILNNCYEDINRNFNKFLYNTLKWFQANQLLLNVEKTKIVKLTSSNFSYARYE
jgi:hypothetical protein